MQSILRSISQLVFIAAAMLVGQVVSAAGKLPQVSADGRILVQQNKYAAVYMKDGAAFRGYDKVAIRDCTVEFHDTNRIPTKWADTPGDSLIQARSANPDKTP